MIKSLIFLSASLVVHGTVGVCLWTSAHWGSVHMSIQRGDNSANIVIVSPGELVSKKSLKKDHKKAKFSEEREDVSDFVQPSLIQKKDPVLVSPGIKTLKSSEKKANQKEAILTNPSLGPLTKETRSKQNAVCIVIPGRQIGVETVSEASNVNPAPRYPKMAILKGWEGETIVKVSVNSSGKVERIEILQSSGHDVLDNTVLETLRLWQFEKGEVKDLEIPIRFVLKNVA